MPDGSVSVSAELLVNSNTPEKKQPGLYAVRVIGRPPEDVIEAIEQRHGVFRSRDMEDDS